jgi:predicted metal-dependent hydrolase
MGGFGKIPPGFESLSFDLRVSGRRRSVGLTVTDRGELVVHAPRGLPLDAIHVVIEKNRAWIEKKRAERLEAWACLEKGKAYFRGKALTVEIATPGSSEIRLADGVLRLPAKMASQDPWPFLRAWYYQQATTLINGSVHHFASRMELAPPPLELCNWRRRWGECHPNRRLRFNWRLVLLPLESLDYVVVHELAHLRVPGHPSRFWQHLGKFLPDYADRRHWLKVFGAPFLLWKFEPEASPKDHEPA